MYIFDRHFNEALSFIKDYQDLADCHLVDFITQNLWDKCLPIRLKSQIEEKNRKNFEYLLENCSELSQFVNQTNALNLKNNPNVANRDDIPKLLPDNDELIDRTNFNSQIEIKTDFMKDKKSYEIAVLSSVIQYLAKLNESSLVIDVGAGKGYLGTTLSQKYGIPVLSIDSCPSRNKSALNRQELMKKKKHQTFPLAKHSIQFIDDACDYSSLVKSHFPEWNHDRDFLLVGLHTCGSLAHAMIKSFLKSESLKTLCVISCCYHLTKDSFSNGFFLSKNARMLAQQSIERASQKSEKTSSTLFYRAILQVLLKSLGIPDSRIGRGAPSNDFKTYAKWALNKIGLRTEEIPTDDKLDQLYHTYAHQKWRMNVFQILRVHLGSVIEAALILDRVLHLERDERCSKVFLIQLFDPLLSPRCYAILAFK